MQSEKRQRQQVWCYALVQQALRKHDRKLRRDCLDGLVAFLRRLVGRAGERSYLTLKPTVEERAWRKDVREGLAERPVGAKTMQRYCHLLAELGLATVRYFEQYTGITLLFLKKGKVSAPPQQVSALTDSCEGLSPTEIKPSAVDGQAQPDSPAPADAVPGAPVEKTAGATDWRQKMFDGLKASKEKHGPRKRGPLPDVGEGCWSSSGGVPIPLGTNATHPAERGFGQ